MSKLAIRRGDTLDREVDLADQDLRIGRGEQNDIVLPDPTKSVSRFHAELRVENGRYVLTDLGSQNGLWSGGKRHQKIALETGIPVTIGPYTVTLTGAARPRVSETLIPGRQSVKTAETVRPQPPSPMPPPPMAEQAAPPPPPRPFDVAQGRPAAPPRPAPPLRSQTAPSGIPKPILFGGIAVALVVVIAIVVVFMPATRYPVGDSPAKEPTPAVSEPTPQELRRQHVTQAQALINLGDFEGALKELDQIPSSEANGPDVVALRAKAADLKAKVTPPAQPPAAVTPAVNTGGGAPPSGATQQPAAAVAGAQGGTPQPPQPGTPAQQPPKPGSAALPAKPVPENARDRDNAERYARARAALDAGAYGNAVNLLTEIQNSDPNYRDVPALLTRAREGVRASAQKALEDAARLETAGDWPAALEQYERAKALDPSMAGAAEESAKRVRGRMRTEGNDAFTRARQYDALGRTADARTLYERAFRYLPDDDPNKKLAKERLDMLRAKP